MNSINQLSKRGVHQPVIDSPTLQNVRHDIVDIARKQHFLAALSILLVSACGSANRTGPPSADHHVWMAVEARYPEDDLFMVILTNLGRSSVVQALEKRVARAELS